MTYEYQRPPRRNEPDWIGRALAACMVGITIAVIVIAFVEVLR